MSTERVITVVSTGGTAAVKDYTTTATTLGEFIKEVGLDIDNKVITESKNKTTLSNLESVLPEGNFNMFIKNKKTKSGVTNFKSMSFAELKSFIMSNDDAKSYLNTEAKKIGKNWTQLSIEDRQSILTKWEKSQAKTTKGEVNAASVKEEVVEKASVKEEVVEKASVKEEVKTTSNGLEEAINSINATLSEIKMRLEKLEATAGEEDKQRAEEERKARLLAEAADMDANEL